jgi:hypothetical protein
MSDKKPASKVSLYPVSAAIWRNTTKDGKAFYSVTFERSYKDGDNWKSSDSFSGTDLLLLEKVAFMAYQEVAKLRTSDKQDTTEE